MKKLFCSKEDFRFIFGRIVVIAVLATATFAAAQTFTRITDQSNPIIADGGPLQYAGASWVDFDNDGDLDLFVNNNKLYRNDGNGVFVKLTTTLGTDQPINAQIFGHGNSWADFDNDGDLDCFISSATSFLYRNDGDANFVKITTGAIGGGASNRGWACAWADYNNDGYVDLAITHPATFVPGGSTTNHLFLNDGPPNFTFTKISTGPIVASIAAYTVGTWSDFDNDGDMDYFIGAGPANGTTSRDYLFRNLLKETDNANFERITSGVIATDLQDGQVWNWIDYDNDGDLDAYLTNWGGTIGGLANRLYRNDNGTFTRIASDPIVTDVGISLSSVWGDFDNDGDLDCYVANDADQADRYYSNNGDGTFTRVTNIAIASSLTHRGATAGDYDNDGDLDLLAVGPGVALGLYRNDTQNGNHWLGVTCIGTTSNRAAVGAKVRVKATINGNAIWQLREISSQNTFNGQNSLRQHFGLGDATIIDSLRIEWPLGQVDSFANLVVDQFVTVEEGGMITGVEQDQVNATPSHFALLQNYPNPFNPTTRIKFELPSASRVTLTVFDIAGRTVAELLLNEHKPTGSHEINFAAQNLASGIYFYKLEAIPASGASERYVETKSMIYLK